LSEKKPSSADAFWKKRTGTISVFQAKGGKTDAPGGTPTVGEQGTGGYINCPKRKTIKQKTK